MFAKEGYALMLGATVIGALLVSVAYWMDGAAFVPLWVVALLIVGFTFYFFRDPQRTPPPDSSSFFLAPADGKIVLIEEVDEPIFLKSRAKKVSIFLSPLNVHVNRIPADGVIEIERYIPGKYLVAWHPKASDRNERSEIGLLHPSGARVLFKQIAGFVARRIVYHLSVGKKVSAGDRFGIVKFGSRMDVLVPMSTRIFVSVGDSVRGGETILGALVGGEIYES